MTAFAEGSLGEQEAQMVLAVAQSIRAGAAMLPEESAVRMALSRWAGELAQEASARLEAADPPGLRRMQLKGRPKLS